MVRRSIFPNRLQPCLLLLLSALDLGVPELVLRVHPIDRDVQVPLVHRHEILVLLPRLVSFTDPILRRQTLLIIVVFRLESAFKALFQLVLLEISQALGAFRVEYALLDAAGEDVPRVALFLETSPVSGSIERCRHRRACYVVERSCLAIHAEAAPVAR